MRRNRSKHRSLGAWRIPLYRSLRILAAVCAVGVATRLAINVGAPLGNSDQSIRSPDRSPLAQAEDLSHSRRAGGLPRMHLTSKTTSPTCPPQSAASSSGRGSSCHARLDARTTATAILRRAAASAHTLPCNCHDTAVPSGRPPQWSLHSSFGDGTLRAFRGHSCCWQHRTWPALRIAVLAKCVAATCCD